MSCSGLPRKACFVSPPLLPGPSTNIIAASVSLTMTGMAAGVDHSPARCPRGGAEPDAPDDMTGIFRPHPGDAGRAISVAAAGACLLGLAFGDPGKFLQAGGHVLVQVSAQVAHPAQCSQAEVQEYGDRLEHLVAELGGGAAGPWLEAVEPADRAAAGFGAGEGELLAPLGGLHDWLVGPGSPAPLVAGAEPGAGHRAGRAVEPAARDDFGTPLRGARDVGDQVIEQFGRGLDAQPDLVVIKTVHGRLLPEGLTRDSLAMGYRKINSLSTVLYSGHGCGRDERCGDAARTAPAPDTRGNPRRGAGGDDRAGCRRAQPDRGRPARRPAPAVPLPVLRLADRGL